MNTHSSIRQSGDVYFKLADMCEDASLMDIAFAEARALAESDKDLARYPEILKRVEKMFTLKSDIIS